MLLQDSGGPNRLSIEVTGYQFPDAPNLARRFSWHMIGGEAVCRHGTWQFHWPALTCDESPLVSAWLTEVATSLARARTLPGPLEFLEPNLAMRAIPHDAGQARIAVLLDVEFRPPWHQQRGASRHAGDPFALSFTMGNEQLQRAAEQWDAERAAFPDHAPPSGHSA